MVAMPEHNTMRWLAGLLLAGLLGGCGQMQPVGAGGDMIDYQVKPGDTLYSIAWRYGYDHRRVAAWNNIPPPFTIKPGQHIYIIPPHQKKARQRLPRERVAVTSHSSKPASKQPKSPPGPSAGSSSTRSKVEKRSSRLQNRNISWRWPTTGKVLTRFSPQSGKKGVDIGGKLGQPVTAAAAGTVVYSGNGLIGYGNLIIIKHNDMYLSAYGHNRRLLVKEGVKVSAGQKIAEMGDSGKEGVMLHFEIRRDGKPVDPLRYLPKNNS